MANIETASPQTAAPQKTKGQGSIVDKTEMARPVVQLLQQTKSLNERLQKIEELLARSRGNVTDPPALDIVPPQEIDWPIAHVSRDKINSQPRQRAVGDWSMSTTAIHEADVFHHHVAETRISQEPITASQLVLQRYIPDADEDWRTSDSTYFGGSHDFSATRGAFLRQPTGELDEPSRGGFFLVAAGLLLILTLFLHA